MYLSILIPTLGKRAHFLAKIKASLDCQIRDGSFQDKVEILTFLDNKENSVGAKRNSLLQRARGRYTVFVDDDDDVSPQYVHSIISVITDYPFIDCIGIRGLFFHEGRSDTFIHSIKYHNYFERNGIYYRPPNHWNPIRREISSSFKFPDINFGEDTDWAMQICRSRSLKTEFFIDSVSYYYRFDPAVTETQSKRDD